MHRLKNYAFRGSIHKWIVSFSMNQIIQVMFDGESPDAVSVDSGVPQGSWEQLPLQQTVLCITIQNTT